jgi:Serine dehydratase beta chain
VRKRLHVSLAFTGKGHAKDCALALGLLGARPASLSGNKNPPPHAFGNSTMR